ncbi:MAG: OmpH family outer membrane protein [Thermodesulfovibrionales bacterium]|nr:OmpH family outer membrane protein [Thermodesulfovibrionales bacterium]
MKTKLIICILSLFTFHLSLATFSFGVDSIKVGCVDFHKVLNESDAGKKAKSDLESLIKSKQSIIDEKGKAIEKLKSDLEKQVSVLSAEAKKSKEEELEKMLREYQRLVQDSQAEVKKKELELTDAIIKEIREIVERIGEEEGYILIVEKAGSIVLYSKKDIDITDTIIKKYNELKATPAKKKK